jgi:isoprenylcysteine carboxyl methyltransferase (ICMT) family protein YpbQ
MQSSTATLPGKLLRHPQNLVIVELFSLPILFTAGIHFLHVPLHNQGYPRFALIR